MEIRNHSMLAPRLNSQDSLVTILNAASGMNSRSAVVVDGVYWPAQHYRLDQTEAFKNQTESVQHDILKQLSHWSLSLSHYIEKFGLNYGAFMINQSESTEEKSLYGLFTAEEVRHRLWLEQFNVLPIEANLQFHPLLPALATALEQGSREALVFTIQVVLEGFGIHHYSALKETCLSPDLAKVFGDILKDEFHHHGMGVQITQKLKLSKESQEQIEELTVLFIRALIEAEWVISAVELKAGGLTQAQRLEFLEQINWKQQIYGRTEKLRQLMKKVGYAGMIESLESKGAFKF